MTSEINNYTQDRKKVIEVFLKDGTIEKKQVQLHDKTACIARCSSDITYYYLELENANKLITFSGWVRKTDVGFFREKVGAVN